METVKNVIIWDFMTAEELSIASQMCIDMTVKKWGNQYGVGKSTDEKTAFWDGVNTI